MKDLGRATEGFYDTALNEAVESGSRKIVPMPALVAKQAKVCRRPSEKTMLCDTEVRSGVASWGEEKVSGTVFVDPEGISP
ncbi:hypothetical protein [Neorhodopirellula pilleata]|uniref:Uncharacterized protein n=1 Tax=Neorhodopirellula pilleata TaxID=2714738 RepID=A0A5C6A055_9BACT|nr:hypothetical protein [Neorhodopirellula pilleata]TWT92949.1 hypothetical protein Pla100_42650 [Neorhodopirellula pilleata]